MAFRQWLKKQTKREDPVGDFARDFLADPKTKGVLLQSVECYLLDRTHNERVFEAFDEARAEYLAI